MQGKAGGEVEGEGMKLSIGRVAAIAVAAVAVGAVSALLLASWVDDEESRPTAFQSRLPPVEFLYLDGPRISNYLGQLEGGRGGDERQIVKETRAANGEASASGFTIGASSQRENSAERTLTQTEASEFARMLNALRKNELRGVSIHQMELERAADLDALREGWLVRFSTDDLVAPGYTRAYVVVRQSATLAALFPNNPGDKEGALRAEGQRLKAEKFAKDVGKNPRITFAVAPKGSDLRILLPVQYEYLTDERSLQEKGRDETTGGTLTVVGKVIRAYAPDDYPCVDEPGPCPREYTDFATREIWKNPLESASNYLINHVSHSCEISKDGNEKKGRYCFLSKLRAQTRLRPPGAVILPIAVYK